MRAEPSLRCDLQSPQDAGKQIDPVHAEARYESRDGVE